MSWHLPVLVARPRRGGAAILIALAAGFTTPGHPLFGRFRAGHCAGRAEIPAITGLATTAGLAEPLAESFVDRERGPRLDRQGQRDGAGLSMATQPVEILRAAMGAVALRFALIARGLDEAGEKEVVSTGAGLLGSPAWTRIMADALGKSVRASVVPEASSRAAPLCSLSRLYRQPVDRGGRGSLW